MLYNKDLKMSAIIVANKTIKMEIHAIDTNPILKVRMTIDTSLERLSQKPLRTEMY